MNDITYLCADNSGNRHENNHTPCSTHPPAPIPRSGTGHSPCRLHRPLPDGKWRLGEKPGLAPLGIWPIYFFLSPWAYVFLRVKRYYSRELLNSSSVITFSCGKGICFK